MKRNYIEESDLHKLNETNKVKFALFCTKQIEHLLTKKEHKDCVAILAANLITEVSKQRYFEIYDKAYDVSLADVFEEQCATDAVAYFAENKDIAHIMYAAYYAVNVLPKNKQAKALQNQWNYYKELLLDRTK